MKRPSLLPETPSKLPDSVHHQLNMYALAASAAGVGMLSSARAAEAKVVYTPAHHVILRGSHLALDLNHDGITDFYINHRSGCSTDGIGSTKPFMGFAMYYRFRAQSTNGVCSGSWADVKNRYLGLRFIIKGETHFGWARLNVACNLGSKKIGLLTGYAYETVPNKPIIAGRTKGPDVITDQPASLGQLARGASAASGLAREARFQQSPLTSP